MNIYSATYNSLCSATTNYAYTLWAGKYHSVYIPSQLRQIFSWIPSLLDQARKICARLFSSLFSWLNCVLKHARSRSYIKVKGIGMTRIQCHKRQLQLQRRCAAQTERTYSLHRPWASPRPRDFDLRRTAMRSPGLPFNNLHPVIRVITWITTYLTTPKGRKAELAWLADP